MDFSIIIAQAAEVADKGVGVIQTEHTLLRRLFMDRFIRLDLYIR